ncbi:MAG TPA: tyrosine-protein phosphatase, partial [Acidimicrobiales bacterium]|nr:tyrosine-protein phosphatase [Acidimicrobiales bacterium]
MSSAVVSVEVQTDEDGSLMVEWQVEGEPAAVDIAAGPTPESVDHQHQITVGVEQTRCRLPATGPGRPYVSVSPHGGGPAVVSADRRVPFEGISNFRDLGGYRTLGGGTVKWGRVFRADALHGMSERDLRLYEGLGLRAVFDLRADSERTERPNPVPSRALAILGQVEEEGGAPATLPTAEAVDGERFLYELYARLILHSAAQIGDLLTALAGDDGLPAVFHCHAGKDRTGLVAAVLLDALGVHRELILDDYELTARYRRRTDQEPTFQKLIDYGLPPETAAGVLTTPRWAMQH